jgi:hypothetical protein
VTDTPPAARLRIDALRWFAEHDYSVQLAPRQAEALLEQHKSIRSSLDEVAAEVRRLRIAFPASQPGGSLLREPSNPRYDIESWSVEPVGAPEHERANALGLPKRGMTLRAILEVLVIGVAAVLVLLARWWVGQRFL